MTTLPERLKELASRMNQDGDKYDAFTLLAEAAQALQAAPEGWVLVPAVPTAEMIAAADSADMFMDTAYSVICAAMLSAAPSPSAALQAGEAK